MALTVKIELQLSSGRTARRCWRAPRVAKSADVDDDASEPTKPPFLSTEELTFSMERRSQEEVRKSVLVDMLNSFTTIYLTLVSIIQGTVFGYGVVFIIQARQNLDLSQWILVLVTGLFYVVVWQEYVYMAVLFAWVPGIKDAIFPFALGTAEIALVSSIPLGVTAWLRVMIVVIIVGVLILANTNWRIHRDKEINRPQRRVLDDFPKWHGPPGALAVAMLQLTCVIALTFLSHRLDDTAAGRNSVAVIAAVLAAAYYIRLVFYVPNLRKLAKPIPDKSADDREEARTE